MKSSEKPSKKPSKKTRILVTNGNGHFEETTYNCPRTFDDGIIVKNVMTGICTSDIAMMKGKFPSMPLHMQGHEGLGQVIDIGKNVFDKSIKIGDFVATRGEPAYADYYPVRENEYVIVPEAHPKYIIEPVACGINVIEGDLTEIVGRVDYSDDPKILLIGTGFLAYIAYKTLRFNDINCRVDVIGSSNKDIWEQEGVTLLSEPSNEYDIVIILKRNNWLDSPGSIKMNGLVIDAVGRAVSKKESDNLLWTSSTTVRPSPRKPLFYNCMVQAVEWIKNDMLNVDKFWTKGYNRNTEWQQAFTDGIIRAEGYNRGYIKWD